MHEKICSACGGTLQSIGRFPLQKGKFSLLLGHWDNFWRGALEVSAFCCENCRKLEFYLADDAEESLSAEEDHMAQTECPFCYAMHDLDDAICPHCGKRLIDL